MKKKKSKGNLKMELDAPSFILLRPNNSFFTGFSPSLKLFFPWSVCYKASSHQLASKGLASINLHLTHAAERMQIEYKHNHVPFHCFT